MQVKNLEDILIFQCQQCFEFPQYPKQCVLCMRIYCRFCNIGLRRVNCDCVNFSDMDPILRHIYDQISIQCLICNENFKLNKIMRHSVKCGYKLNQDNSIKIYKCIYCCNETIIGKQTQKNYCNFCLQTFLKCKNDERQIILRQEQIEDLDKQKEQCNFCQIERQQFQLINHEKICDQVLVKCDCDQQLKRIQFMSHYKLCSITMVQIQKSNLDREQLLLNLTNIQALQKFIFSSKSYKIFCKQQQQQQIELSEDFFNQVTSQNIISD